MVIELKGYGEYLGVKHKGFALYRERKLKQVIPFHSLKGVLIAPNNTVSTNALLYLAMYNVPTILVSQSGRIVSTITSLNVNANAITRIKQYEASQKKKGFNIAKAIVKAKIENQIKVLQKYTQDIQSLKCRIEGLKSYNARKMDMNVRDKLGLFEAVASSSFAHKVRKITDFMCNCKTLCADHFFQSFSRSFSKLKRTWEEVRNLDLGYPDDPNKLKKGLTISLLANILFAILMALIGEGIIPI